VLKLGPISLGTATRPEAPTGVPELNDSHRDLSGGAIRASVFGFSDGLVSNVSLLLGVAGADAEPGIVRLAGLAGLLAGAFSMAAGEYISMTANKELIQRELEVERRSLAAEPDAEQRELESIYRSRGISAEMAQRLAAEVMQNPQIAFETHVREELGIDPGSLGAPVAASGSSFVAFSLGAAIPLVPWFFLEDTAAVAVSVLLSAVAALVVGAVIGLSSGRSPLFGALRQLLVGALAGGVTYTIGRILGVQVT